MDDDGLIRGEGDREVEVPGPRGTIRRAMRPVYVITGLGEVALARRRRLETLPTSAALGPGWEQLQLAPKGCDDGRAGRSRPARLRPRYSRRRGQGHGPLAHRPDHLRCRLYLGGCCRLALLRSGRSPLDIPRRRATVYCGYLDESRRQRGHSAATAPLGRPPDAWSRRSGYGRGRGPLLDAPALPTTGLPTIGTSSAPSARRTTAARSSSTAWPRWSGRSKPSGPGRAYRATTLQPRRAPNPPPGTGR